MITNRQYWHNRTQANARRGGRGKFAARVDYFKGYDEAQAACDNLRLLIGDEMYYDWYITNINYLRDSFTTITAKAEMALAELKAARLAESLQDGIIDALVEYDQMADEAADRGADDFAYEVWKATQLAVRHSAAFVLSFDLEDVEEIPW